MHAAHAFENARLMKDLKASETRFRIALAGARTAVYEQDTSLRYVWYYNPLVPQEPLGKTHEQELPADEAAMLTEREAAGPRARARRVHEEMDFTFGGEERRHFRETIEPLRDDTGKIVGVIGAATDITEQQRTQQQLTEELDFRERMMGILGHDLRNPLGTIMMASDLLLRRPNVAAVAREHLLRIRRAAGRMQEMIDTLLDFTRARFLGKVPITRVPADLGEIARAAVDEMRVVWPDHAIDLEVHGDSHGEWDPARMAQTITNLVGQRDRLRRARDRRAASRSRETDRDVELKVHNHGPPIPAGAAAGAVRAVPPGRPRGSLAARARAGALHRPADRARPRRARSASSRPRRRHHVHAAPAPPRPRDGRARGAPVAIRDHLFVDKPAMAAGEPGPAVSVECATRAARRPCGRRPSTPCRW